MSLANFTSYLRSQLRTALPLPTKPFTNQTIIVTGANTGLGLEAARHFVRLDAARVILAVRSLAKGEAAVRDLLSPSSSSVTGNGKGSGKAVVEAWELDLSSHSSIKSFARRADAELERVDVLIANAGVFMREFEVAEDAGGDEMTVAVNVVGHMLLAMLLLPRMRETAVQTGGKGVVVFTGSFTHWMAPFPERHSENIFGELANRNKARMKERLVHAYSLNSGLV
jgi:NAD(P)-dependent dehydrogenase (short-subunit alcohol dehydrogenase family)